MVDLINTDSRHLNLGQCKKTDNWNLQNLIYPDLKRAVVKGGEMTIVTMQRLHTETPVLPEGGLGWVALTGALLPGQSHGLTALALANSDITV